MKPLEYAHGELWLKRRDFADIRDFKPDMNAEKSRDVVGTRAHYKLKLQAVWGLLGYYDRDESFDAVEAFTIHCSMSGRANTLREDIAC